MTGPGSPFQEVNGLDSHVPPTRELVVGEKQHGRAIFERSTYKCYPAEYNSQALISAFIAVRDQVKGNGSSTSLSRPGTEPGTRSAAGRTTTRPSGTPGPGRQQTTACPTSWP